MPLELDLRPMKRAVRSLQAGLDQYEQNPENDVIRDGCIQRFEFTYELSHKMLKRFLEVTSANPAEIDAMSFQDLIRTGSERGLLKTDWSNWKDYRRARSITSHIYDERKALEVFSIIPIFKDEADYLYQRLATEAAR